MKNKTLYLSLKKKWFDMIKSGEKLEEYREIRDYWTKRFCSYNQDDDRYYLLSEYFNEVVFTLGYPKKDDSEKRMRFKINEITKDYGREDWGAETGKKYYVIKLGERLS